MLRTPLLKNRAGAMCSLEAFVTDNVLWQRSIFLPPHGNRGGKEVRDTEECGGT